MINTYSINDCMSKYHKIGKPVSIIPKDIDFTNRAITGTISIRPSMYRRLTSKNIIHIDLSADYETLDRFRYEGYYYDKHWFYIIGTKNSMLNEFK